MSTPIKTGAWLYMEMYNCYFRCDLYQYGDVLLARCNPQRVYDIDTSEGLWATMHEFDDEFRDDNQVTYVSQDFSVHYTMKFVNGGWHDIKIA